MAGVGANPVPDVVKAQLTAGLSLTAAQAATIRFGLFILTGRGSVREANANDLILQMRTWEANNVGNTPGFGGDVEKALRSIKAPLLYMPSETDLYFPVGDARYEAVFIPGVTLLPIPSLWGHTAGAASNPADAKFLNENIRDFLASKRR